MVIYIGTYCGPSYNGLRYDLLDYQTQLEEHDLFYPCFALDFSIHLTKVSVMLSLFLPFCLTFYGLSKIKCEVDLCLCIIAI